MSVFAKMRLFQKAATAVLIIFMGLMLLVVAVAYSRPSGTTRQDMSQAQFERYEAMKAKQASRDQQTLASE